MAQDFAKISLVLLDIPFFPQYLPEALILLLVADPSFP